MKYIKSVEYEPYETMLDNVRFINEQVLLDLRTSTKSDLTIQTMVTQAPMQRGAMAFYEGGEWPIREETRERGCK